MLFAILLASARDALAQAPGTADPTWTITPLPNQNLNGIAIQPGGKVVAVGYEHGQRFFTVTVYRFDDNGNLDVSFGTEGKLLMQLGSDSSSPTDIVTDPAGRIYIAGSYRDDPPWSAFCCGTSGFAVARILPDGSLDYSFGDYGVSKVPLNGVTLFGDTGMPTSTRDIALQPDGKLLFATFGHEATSPVGVQSIVTIRFDANGKLDPTFASGGLSLIQIPGNNGTPNAMRVASDGSIFVAGGEDGNTRGFVLKLSPQGNIDPAFGTAGKVVIQQDDKFSANWLELQKDNKIVVAGRRWRTAESAEGDGLLALRLNTNGSLDHSFGTAGYSFHNPSEAFNYATALALGPGGNILVGGSTSTGGGVSAQVNPLLLQLTPDGLLDATFGGTGIVMPLGRIPVDIEVFDAAYVLTRNLLFSAPGASVLSVQKFITRTATVVPQVTIIGGNKTIADTDGVGGEVVTVNGIATDSDGTITQTAWLLNGVPAASGPSATLTLGNGSNVISFIALDNSSAKATTTATYNVLAPTTPLPRIGSYSSHGLDTHNTQFSIAFRNADGALVTSTPATQALTMTGFIFPPEGYDNIGADIFVVVSTSFGWFMRNETGAFVPWNQSLAELVPAYENMKLATPLRVPMYSGQLPSPGLYQMFIGFRTQGSEEVIYNVTAGSVTVTAQ